MYESLFLPKLRFSIIRILNIILKIRMRMHLFLRLIGCVMFVLHIFFVIRLFMLRIFMCFVIIPSNMATRTPSSFAYRCKDNYKRS